MNCLAHQKKNAQPLDCLLAMTKESIFKLPRPHQGQIVHATDTGDTYIFNDGWKVIEGNVSVKGDGLKMNLYDLNSSIIEQLPTITDFTQPREVINNYKHMTENQYYMLYGKDISYFTIFRIEEKGECENLGAAVIECILNVGEVKAVDLTEDKTSVEIWVMNQDKAICLYLFPYDTGIVTVTEG